MQCICQKCQHPGQHWPAGVVGGFWLPVGGLGTGPPGLGHAPGPHTGQNLVLGPAQAKTQCIWQKPRQRGQFWAAQAARGPKLPVSGPRRAHTWPGWFAKPTPRQNLVLGLAQAKTQCNCQKTPQPGQFWRAQAVRCFWPPVGDFRPAHTWPGWAAGPGTSQNLILKAARGFLLVT